MIDIQAAMMHAAFHPRAMTEEFQLVIEINRKNKHVPSTELQRMVLLARLAVVPSRWASKVSRNEWECTVCSNKN